MESLGAASSARAPAPRKGGEIQPWRVDSGWRQRRKSKNVEKVGEKRKGSLPSLGDSPIQKGNSDPFDALPITVDPITNRILSWFRDYGIPVLYPLEKTVFGLSMPAAQRAWARTIVAIQSPALSHPHLASVSILMARSTQSDVIRSLGLHLKGKSYAVLRMRLEQKQESDALSTWRMILHMCWAEYNTYCLAAAKTHLASLAMCLRGQDPSKLDADFRTELLQADAVLAGIMMSVPLFQGREWAAEEVHEEWRSELENRVGTLIAPKFLDLHETVRGMRLRSTLTRLREMVAVAELVVSHKPQSYSVFRWLDLRLLSCELELLGLSYGSHCRLFEGSLGAPSFSRGSCVSCCVSLTALAWICATFATRVRRMKQILVSRLQTIQRRCGFDELGSLEADDLALWSFYVGSLLEKMIESETGQSATRGWHSVKFEMASRAVGRGDWSSISKVLGRFLYSDTLRELNLS